MSIYLGKDKVNLFSGARLNLDNVLLQEKTVTPSESSVTIGADADYTGLSLVTVEPIPNTYIGSKITRKTAATYTPSTQDQAIEANQYLSGTQVISGDANLISSNIRSGVSIFGVNGNSNVVNTSSGTATANHILKGYKAWVGGAEITGNIVTKGATTITPTTESQTAVDKNVYTTGIITVAPIPSNYIEGPSSITAGDYMIGGATTSSKINGGWTDLGVYRWTIKKAGTYKFKWCMMKPAVSIGNAKIGTRLVHNGVTVYENNSFDDNVNYNTPDVTCSVGDTISVQGRYETSYTTYSGYIYGVSIHTSWENPFIG